MKNPSVDEQATTDRPVRIRQYVVVRLSDVTDEYPSFPFFRHHVVFISVVVPIFSNIDRAILALRRIRRGADTPPQRQL